LKEITLEIDEYLEKYVPREQYINHPLTALRNKNLGDMPQLVTQIEKIVANNVQFHTTARSAITASIQTQATNARQSIPANPHLQ
jgi:hypothetical protein